MSQSSVTFNPQLRDVRGRFVKAEKLLMENKRKAVRLLGRRWVEIAREEAPEGKTGKFRESIRYRTFVKDKEIGFTSSSAQPLGTWITGGTRPHRIYPRRANALYFYFGRAGKWTVVPKGGGFKTHVSGGKLWIGKGYVHHPGTRPNRYTDRAYLRWAEEMETEINAVADKFVVDLVGK